MLNDLRSSPSSRLTSNSHSHSPLHQRSSSTSTYTPFALNIGTNTTSSGGTATNHSDYLQSALRSNNQVNSEQKSIRDEYNSYSNYRANQQRYHQPPKDEHIPSTSSSSSAVSGRQHHNLHQSFSANRNQDQGFNHYPDNGNYNSHATNSDRNNNTSNNSKICQETNSFTTAKTGSCANNSADNKNSSSSSSASTSTSFQGFSTDVTHVSKLPLYTYQHKQLQQPQTLHIKLLQQQQATKAIASQITDTETTLQAQNVVNRHKKTLMIMSDGRTTGNLSNCGSSRLNASASTSTSNTSTRTTTTNPLSTTSTSLDFRIKSSISTSTTGTNSGSGGKSTHICNINSMSAATSSAVGCSSWQLQSTSAATASTSSTSFLR